MKLKRYIKAILLGLAFSLLIIGCTWGSYVTTDSTENNTANSMTMSYGTFKGYKCSKIKLKKGETLELSIDINTKSGYLDVSLLNENKEELYKVENPSEVVEEKIQIESDGDYVVKVEGKHSGSFNLQWQIE